MNIDQLRKHPAFPFTNFMENDLEFLLLEMFWIELFRSCINSHKQLAQWQAIYPAERNASPILVMANDTINRAIYVKLRINEHNKPLYPAHAPMEDTSFLPFDLWFDELFDSTGHKTYSGLVISTEMSMQALIFSEKAITHFCRDVMPTENIQTMIDQYYIILEERGYYWK